METTPDVATLVGITAASSRGQTVYPLLRAMPILGVRPQVEQIGKSDRISRDRNGDRETTRSVTQIPLPRGGFRRRSRSLWLVTPVGPASATRTACCGKLPSPVPSAGSRTHPAAIVADVAFNRGSTGSCGKTCICFGFFRLWKLEPLVSRFLFATGADSNGGICPLVALSKPRGGKTCFNYLLFATSPALLRLPLLVVW